MLKMFFYFVGLIILLAGGASIYHLYKVKAKNKAEMNNFSNDVALQANLGKVLVVYYSLSGHTKDIALQIAEKTNADLYEIETAETYSSPSVYMKSKQELTSQNYPELKNNVLPDASDYDVIFVGAPVWWYTMAPALYSFLNKFDFKNKNAVPFSTQGSNFGSFFKDFADKAQNAEILQSENFNNMEEKYKPQISNKINAWLNKIAK
ncbi:MAG: NAD(P)H-dependent oxidoreductase [Alphaproteobacteria bacterium]|nr:NAD(P)H-dependent oxidoreductase [Alphaproteobacteria bacterium]